MRHLLLGAALVIAFLSAAGCTAKTDTAANPEDKMMERPINALPDDPAVMRTVETTPDTNSETTDVKRPEDGQIGPSAIETEVSADSSPAADGGAGAGAQTEVDPPSNP